MQRIMIIGSGGSGKSTLARLLGQRLNIPVYHLDLLFWEPGWKMTAPTVFKRRLQDVLWQDSWITDGNFSESMSMRLPLADTIIFLDLPTMTCLGSIIARRWRYRGRSRPDMTEGNHERLGLDMLKWVLTYRRTRRPGVMRMLEPLRTNRQVMVLKSRAEVQAFLQSLPSVGGS